MTFKPGDGRFKPGQSGNPGGKRKGVDALVREQIGDDTGLAILKVHAELAQGRIPDGVAIQKFSGRDMAASASIVLDRLWGKPKQTIDGEMAFAPHQLALIAALQLTPHERRKKLDEIAAEDEAELAKAAAGSADDPDAE